MPWDSVSPYHGSRLMSTRTMFCGYDFTLEQLDETCSRKKNQKKKCLGVFVLHVVVVSLLDQLGPK